MYIYTYMNEEIIADKIVVIISMAYKNWNFFPSNYCANVLYGSKRTCPYVLF